jgi:hypothetical protein
LYQFSIMMILSSFLIATFAGISKWSSFVWLASELACTHVCMHVCSFFHLLHLSYWLQHIFSLTVTRFDMRTNSLTMKVRVISNAAAQSLAWA